MGELLKNVRALLVGAVALLGGGLAAALLFSTSAAATATPTVLTGNHTLAAGGKLVSPDGHLQLYMSSGGDLIEAVSTGRTLWDTGTKGSGNTAVLQSNGNLVVKAANGNTLWSSNTSGGGCPALSLQNDGQLVIYGPSARDWTNGRVVSGLYSGEELTVDQPLYSQNEHYELYVRQNGAFAVLNDSGNQVWGSGTAGDAGDHAQMLSDGNLIVQSAAGKVLWSSGTGDSAGAHAHIEDSGALVLTSTAGKTLTTFDTSPTAGTGSPFNPVVAKGSATPCPPPAPAPAPTPTVTNTVTTVVTTVQTSTVYEAPPVKKGKLSVKVAVAWHYLRDTTRLRGLRFGPFPHGSVVSAVFQEPHKRRHIVKGDSKRSMAHLVHWAEEIVYHPGDIFELAINRRGDSEEKMVFTARGAELPACRPACTIRR